MPVSRRDFLEASTALAAAFGLRAVGADAVGTRTRGTPVIWVQAQSCTGCSVSLLNGVTGGSIESLLQSTLDCKFHSTLMAASGPNAIAAAAAAQSAGHYVLVIEGAIPTGAGGKYCHLWPGTTALDGVRTLAAGATHVLAVGACAAYGGVPASTARGGVNPTGAKGVSSIISGTPIINIPGCPPHPDWIVGTVASLLAGVVPPLDAHGRPTLYFGKKICAECPFDNDHSPDRTERNCLEDFGCKGPVAHGNCSILKWNNMTPGAQGVNWCIGARSPCLGCTQPDFPDRMMPFHAEVRD